MTFENEYKKYTIQAKRGIKGEAFFESLVCDYCIPHRVVGPKDVGIDYICEWVYKDKPTGILFGVQVKTSTYETTKPKLVETEKGYNNLEKYQINNTNFKIETKTLHYWRGFSMPMYLFIIIQKTNKSKEELDCYYKRFTPILTEPSLPETYEYNQDFYKVNNGSSFFAFKDADRKFGFARDLFIDHVRWCYYKGCIIYMSPREFGLKQFPENAIFKDLFGTYQEKILSAYKRTEIFLKRFEYI